jgi:hypothetical protein
MILSACSNNTQHSQVALLREGMTSLGPRAVLLALNLTTGFLDASFFCTASAIAVAASGDCLDISAISSSRYTAALQTQVVS